MQKLILVATEEKEKNKEAVQSIRHPRNKLVV